MKLLSRREISIESLVDVAEMLGEESFYLDSVDDAEEEICDRLRDPCFMLSGTEQPFEDEDIKTILRIVKSAAEKISNELYDAVERVRPIATMLIQAEAERADEIIG